MRSETESKGRDERLVLEGELSVYTAAETLARLRAHLETHQDCELDLSGVTEMDSAGLQLLLWTQRAAQARGGRLRLVALGDRVVEVLALLHLGSHFGLDSACSAPGGTA